MSKRTFLFLGLATIFALAILGYGKSGGVPREHAESPLYRLSLERTVSRLKSEPEFPVDRRSLPEKLTASMVKEAYAWGGTSGSTCGSTCGGTCPSDPTCAGYPTCESTCSGSTCEGTCAGDPTCDTTCSCPPEVFIDSISPSPAGKGADVNFAGGISGGEPITAYEWASSIDSVFGTELSLVYSGLTEGAHTVSFRAQNEYGWSSAATEGLTVFKVDITTPDTWPVTMELGEDLGVGAAVTPPEAAGGNFHWDKVTGSGTGEGTFSPNDVDYGEDIGFTATAAGVLNIKVTYTLEGSSTDSETKAVTINLDNILPEIAITSPPDGFLTTGTLADISGTVHELNLEHVKITVGVEELDAEVDGIYFTCSGVPLPAEGDNTITATATDTSNQTSSDSIAVTRDTTPPTVSFNQSVTLNSEVTDNEQIKKVEFTKDETVERTLYEAPYQYIFSMDENSQTVRSTAHDEAGNTADAESVGIQLTPIP